MTYPEKERLITILRSYIFSDLDNTLTTHDFLTCVIERIKKDLSPVDQEMGVKKEVSFLLDCGNGTTRAGLSASQVLTYIATRFGSCTLFDVKGAWFDVKENKVKIDHSWECKIACRASEMEAVREMVKVLAAGQTAVYIKDQNNEVEILPRL